MIWIEVIVLLACSVLIAHAAEVSSPIGDNLDAICDGKKIDLTKQSHLSSIIKQIDDGRGGRCTHNTVKALRELHNVITENKDKECSMDAFENYRTFYMAYLNNSDKEKKDFLKLPQPVKKFAIAYGVQLSARCRVSMVKILLKEATDIMKPEYFDAVKELIGPKGPIAHTLGCTNHKPDKLLFPAFIGSAGEKREQSEGKVDLHVDSVAVIKKIQTRCELQFKPVYVDLMTPVLRFANLGFEHRSRELKDIIKEASKNPDTSDIIGQWSRVAFMCEIFGQIELVVDEEDADKIEGSDIIKATVTTKDNTSAEKETKGKILLLDTVNIDDEAIERVVFEPKLSVEIPDEVYPKELTEAVNKVKTNRAERVNMRARYWKIMRDRLWDEVKSLRAGPLVNQIYGGLKKTLTMKWGDKEDAKTKLVKSISSLADGNVDKPVAMVGVVIFLIIIGVVILVGGAAASSGSSGNTN